MSNIEQKLPCEVVQDILPLYHDGVCSGASRKMVENHLQECRTCKTLLQEMDETEMDMALADETKKCWNTMQKGSVRWHIRQQ